MSVNPDSSISSKSNRYGFARFENEELAKAAIEKMNGAKVGDSEIVVERYEMNRDQRKSSAFNNLYVKEFPVSWSDDDLKNYFSKYGTLGSVTIMKDDDGKSKGFGFVCFDKPEDATQAMEKENNTIVDGKALYVAKAEKKSDRQKALEKSTAKVNVYIRNFDKDVTE